MTPNDNQLKERYIYQVTSRLPKEQRDEAERELSELIDDMSEQSGSMEKALTKLGSPAEYAKKYRDDSNCLIGPEYYDTYLWIIKIALICSAIPIIATAIIGGVTNCISAPSTGNIDFISEIMADSFANIISDCIVSCFSVFGIVTLIFAIMERQKVKIDIKKPNSADNNGVWTPKLLSPIPDKKALISRGDSIFSIVFTIIFCVLLIFVPEFFSAIFSAEDTYRTIPIFNLENWDKIMPIFVFSMLVGLADKVLRLISGCYCRLVMISNIVCGVIQIILAAVLLKKMSFWNPKLITDIQSVFPDKQLGEYDVLRYGLDGLSDLIFTGICIITVFSIAVTVYKTIRYGNSKLK